MIWRPSSFPFKEYALGVREGGICPECHDKAVIALPPQPGKRWRAMACTTCGASLIEFQRNLFLKSGMVEFDGRPVWAGDSYESLQSWATAEPSGPAISDLWFDVDRDDVREAVDAARELHARLERLAPGHTRIYYSGSKGFHLQVDHRVFGATPSEDNHLIWKRLALEIADGIEVDETAYSARRVFRMNNTRHTATGRFKTELHPAELEHLEPDDYRVMRPVRINTTRPAFDEAAHARYLAARQEHRYWREVYGQPGVDLAEHRAGGDGVHACVTHLSEHTPTEPGMRHKAYLTLATYMKTFGFTATEARDRLLPVAVAGEHTLGAGYLRDQMLHDIESVYASPQLGFHCAYAKALGACDPACPINSLERQAT